MSNNQNQSRRNFIQQAAIVSAGLMLANSSKLFSNPNSNIMSNNLKAKGYAGKDENGKLDLWK